MISVLNRAFDQRGVERGIAGRTIDDLAFAADRGDVAHQRGADPFAQLAAIATARGWLDELIAGRVLDIADIALREKRSARSTAMLLSLAFLTSSATAPFSIPRRSREPGSAASRRGRSARQARLRGARGGTPPFQAPPFVVHCTRFDQRERAIGRAPKPAVDARP